MLEYMLDRELRDALSHLPRFVVFAELSHQGSFKATAASLGLSPSTVTHHINALEDALGIRLVERTSRKMTLTSAGQLLLHEADDMVRSWRRGVTLARLHTTEPVGTLTVTAPDVVAERFVVPAVQRLLALHPRVEVNLRIESANLDLVSERIDVAVRRGPLPDSGYGARLLFRDRYGLYAHPELAATWPVDHPRDLAEAPWLQYAVRSGAPELIGPDGERHTIRCRPRVVSSTGRTHIATLAAGLGFGLVPTRLISSERAAGDLVHVLPDWTWDRADFYAVTPSPGPQDAKVMVFVEKLVEVFGEEPAAA